MKHTTLIVILLLFIISCKEDEELPYACFNVSAIEVEPNVALKFSSCSENIDSLRWNMGNGKQFTQKSFEYAYTEENTYHVILTAIKGNERKQVTKEITIAYPPQNKHDKDITKDEVWNNDYIHIIKNIKLTGAKLKIEKNTRLKFEYDGSIEIGENATLIIEGEEGEEVKMTSNSVFPRAGDWKGIIFSETATNSYIKHCNINYAGGGDTEPKGAIIFNNIKSDKISVTSCKVINSAGAGIYIKGKSPELKANKFENNAKENIVNK